MRILFAITKGEVGGAQRHLEIIADGLSDRGHDVAALVERPSSLADRLATKGVTVVGWDSIVRNPHPVRDLAARRQLKAAVDEFGPDILHIHSAKAGVLGRGILRPPDGVTIFTCHHASFGPGRKPSHRLIGRPVEQLSLRFVDGIISVGTRDMPLLGKLAGEAPLYLVRNAVPTVGSPRSPEALQKVALWVARLQHPKDPSIIIKAWENVVARHPTARLRICGTGPLSDHVNKLVAGSPVAANIDYLGFVDDLGHEYARASLFVLTTHVEGGTTMATLEAMSEGLVPVVTDAGDAFMLPSEDAGVMTHTSAKPVATAISDLFDNPERVSRLRSNALSYARERFTPTTMVEGTIAAYEDVLRRSGMAERPPTAVLGNNQPIPDQDLMVT